MKNRNKKQRNLLLLLIVLLTITVGFALLSTTLFINGTSTIKGNTWNIHWVSDSIAVTDGSVDAEDPVVSGTGTDTISFSANFDVPGDFYEFTVDAKNDGTVDGIITGVSYKVYDATGENELTGANIPSNILYSVTYADTGTPAVGDILAKTESKKYKVRVQFDPEATELPENAVAYTYKFSVTYEQYKASAQTPIPTPAGPVSISASKTTASTNEEVTVTVSFTAAAWNLELSGGIVDTSTLKGYNSDGENQLVTQDFTFKKTEAGTYTITVTGDITDENDVPTENISESVTITVQ